MRLEVGYIAVMAICFSENHDKPEEHKLVADFQTLTICFDRSGTKDMTNTNNGFQRLFSRDDQVIPWALYLSVKPKYHEISMGFSSSSSLKLPLRSVEGKLIPFRKPKSSKWNVEQHKR